MKRRRLSLLSLLIVLITSDVSAARCSDCPIYRLCRDLASTISPVRVSVQVSKGSSIHIHMGISNIQDDISGYKVYFTRDYELSDDSYAEWQQIDVKSSDRNYTLRMDVDTLHLKPATKYRLRVTASTDQGETPPSEVVEFRTGSVPLAPSNVNVVVSPTNSLTVYFDAALTPNNTGSQPTYVKEYTVEFTADDPASSSAVWKSFTFLVDDISEDSTRISKSFSNDQIQSSTQYSLKVHTYGSAKGTPSNLVFFETYDGAHRPTVSIEGPSVLKMDPSLLSGYELKCEAEGDPSSTIRWLIDESPLISSTHHVAIKEEIQDQKTISQVIVPTRSRSEVFTCVGYNSIGSSRASVSIEILGPGGAPTDIAATSDALGVHVSWNPPLFPNGNLQKYIVYWSGDETAELADWSQAVINANKTRVLIKPQDHDGPLFVRVQSTSDRGPGIISEKITAISAMTDMPLRTEIDVTNMSKDENGTVLIGPGEDIEFKCTVEGRPPPSVSFYWSELDPENEELSVITPTVLQYRNIPPNSIQSHPITTHTYSDGFLICRGQNAREINEDRVMFIVNKMQLNDSTPQSAPGNIRVESSDNDDLVLMWDPVEQIDGTEMHYNVYLSNDSTQPIRKWTNISVNGTSVDLTPDLVSPSSEYHFRISAVNEYGEGILSAPIPFSTHNGGPRSPPRNVEIGVDEANVVFIAWDRPKSTNGSLINYKIYFTRDPGMEDADYKNWQFVDVATTSDRFRYKMELHKVGLRPKTLYRVCLTARNDIAESEPTEVQEFETTQGELPVPTDVEVDVQGDNTVIVHFTAVRDPEDHSTYIEEYDVLLSPSTDALVARFLPVAISEKTFDPNTTQMTMKISPTEVSTMTQYWVKVQTHIHNRDIQASKPKRFQTGDGKVPPQVTIRQGDRVKREPSRRSHLYIECDSEGIPRPVISWLWNGDNILDNDSYWKIDDITFDPIHNKHKASSRLAASNTSRSGTVTCEAFNNKGHALINTSVVVTGPGSVVRNLTIVPYHNAINLSWQEPEVTNGKIQSYLIYMTTSPEEDLGEWDILELCGDELSRVVDGIEPETDYTFRIQSSSELGYGFISDAITVNSGKIYIPLGVHIQLLNIENGNQDEVEIEPGATIRFHCLAWGNPRPSVAHYWTTEGIQDTELGTDPLLFAGLYQLDKYSVSTVNSVTDTHTTRDLVCEAFNDDGVAQHKIRFHVYKPGSPPRSIQYVVSQDDSVTISWKKPALSNGNITAYLSYITSNCSLPMGDWRGFEIDSNRRRFTFVEGELEPNSTYYLRMAAENIHGVGLLSDVVEVRTANGASGPVDAPYELSVEVNDLNILDISWIPPENPNGPIMAYLFYFTRDAESTESEYRQWQNIEIPQIEPLTNQYTLEGSFVGLREDCDYRMRLSAKNAIAEGPASEVAYFRTNIGQKTST